MSILADIGGTFVRFARDEGGDPGGITKYKAEDFEGLEDALARYCEEQGRKTSGALRIATAGYEDGGVWKFVNNNKWVIDPAALEEKGWRVEIILNDFEAGVWALPGLNAENMTTLKDAPGASGSKCLFGPGTGLGLGYLHGGDAAPFVQKTHGGHMPLAARTDEQWTAAQTIKAQVFEHVVSGPGLQKLREIYDPDTALRLFHEFFGLFAATAVISGNAYGGVYLTGGVLESLIADDLFNFPLFEEWLCVQGAASVTRDLHATPIYHVIDPYPALKGLLNA